MMRNREFISYVSIIKGACLLWCGLSLNVMLQAQPQRYVYQHPQMGTTFRVVIYTENEPGAKAAVKEAFKRIDELNHILSDYDPESELNALSASAGTGRKVEVSEELWNVLGAAQRFSRQSKGAFDVTIGPLVKLWRRARHKVEMPPTRDLLEAQQQVGYRLIKLYPKEQKVLLKQAGMRLDLGGIAKGYAADEALKVLTNKGFPQAMVDAGGDIVAGEAPGKTAWKIGLGEAASLSIHNKGVATSGDTFQYVELDGKRYSHLIDPHTGLGLTTRTTVTVIAQDGMTSDALASAISVMGLKKGVKLARKYKAEIQIEYWANLDQDDKQLFQTEGFKHMISD